MKFVPWLALLALLCGTRSLDAQDKLTRADLFGPDKLWNIHVKLGAKEYQLMQPKGGGMGFPFGKKDEPKKEVKKDAADKADVHKNKAFGIEFPFVKGDLEFDGKLVKDVGIRYKGNATYGVSQQTLKRPFKIDINHYVDQKLHGLNGLVLGNNAFDPTRLHDALAYHLFRAAQVPASRTAFVKLSLTVADKHDKTYVGAYTMMEPVDKAFLRERFGSDKGMLLKPERLPGLLYLGENWDAYKDKYNPKREPTEAQKRRLIEFTKLVNQADDATFNQKIGEFLDIDAFLRFAAVNSLISNLDGFFAGGHNYFLYLNPKDNRFHFMPWDLDVTFGGHPFVGGDQTDWSIAQPYMGKNRLTERVLAVKANDDLFRRHARTLIEGPFSVKQMKTAIDTMEATIKDAIAKEPAPKFGMGMGFPGGKQMGLREFVAKRNESVLAQLDGKSKGKPMSFSPGGPGGGKGKGPPAAPDQLMEALGPAFMIFSPKIQQELKLSDKQKRLLDNRLPDTIQATMAFFQKLNDAKPEERGKTHQEYREKAGQDLAAFLKESFRADQLNRLRQLELQKEGLFSIMGRPDVAAELKITDEQRQAFMKSIQEAEKKLQATIKQAGADGNPNQIRPKMLKLRAETESRLDALLSDAQKPAWRKMLGKPFDFGE